jgi:OOP family OmpA-OmpF porin
MGGSGDADMWVATRDVIGQVFRSPVNLGPALNSPSYDGEPNISADGLTLYFGSDRSRGIGHRDIWVATRASLSSPFGPPTDVGKPVDSASEEATPDLSRGGRTLLFLSDRPGSHLFDLWQSTRTMCAGS